MRHLIDKIDLRAGIVEIRMVMLFFSVPFWGYSIAFTIPLYNLLAVVFLRGGCISRWIVCLLTETPMDL